MALQGLHLNGVTEVGASALREVSAFEIKVHGIIKINPTSRCDIFVGWPFRVFTLTIWLSCQRTEKGLGIRDKSPQGYKNKPDITMRDIFGGLSYLPLHRDFNYWVDQ